LGLFPAPRAPPNCGPHPVRANDPAHKPFRKSRRDIIPELISTPLIKNHKKTYASNDISNPTKFTLLYQEIPLSATDLEYEQISMMAE
jgi:hypothetical protein